METRSYPYDLVLRLAREIWRRDPMKARAKISEDRRFREFFGCSAIVISTIWRWLEKNSLVPDGCEVLHLLWSLVFMKVYPLQQVMCTLINVLDPKTFRGRVWKMIEAVANLEAYLVSIFSFQIFVFMML